MTEPTLADRSIDLVREWIDPQQAGQHRPIASARRLAQMLKDPDGLEFTIGFVDRVVRPEDPQVAARNLRQLAASTPAFLPWIQRFALKLGALVSRVAPTFMVNTARRTLRRMVGHLVVDARPQPLGRAIGTLRKGRDRLNLNLLGEAVLGDGEAEHRRDATLRRLERPDVDYVSITVSSVANQLSIWAFDESVQRVVTQLVPLYEKASEDNTFINLDMEEYPRPRPDDRGVQPGARGVPRPRGRHRAPGLPARRSRRHAAPAGVGRPSPRRRWVGRQGACRQGCQPRPGAGRRHPHRRGRPEPVRHRLRVAARR